jgi:hypothetical protein
VFISSASIRAGLRSIFWEGAMSIESRFAYYTLYESRNTPDINSCNGNDIVLLINSDILWHQIFWQQVEK